ncbi:winged helix-turn-helix transcriptional regulator [Actinoplanes sp. NEAU-A12]|uniref:Winged helix-turn-helix transcriptional regulator n=1 Tax=Actinoplanes sandaracinus TaxID=3045177 RepID=A0ABT6WX99_9ACTN|nr:winged helix-turn-helix transcriptional regulator [Actinoplanes sandaracinus]MDI6104364.1 winged helix-turn-helix transcriptional regulator [Actinoplanes sandaracinus]
MTNDLEPIYKLARRKLNRVILKNLRTGPLQYSQLLHAVSQDSPKVVYPKTLTHTLKFLQAEGLVEHHREERLAVYRLTAEGVELMDVISRLGRWKEEHHENEDGDGQ